jgi:hypothetical protein
MGILVVNAGSSSLKVGLVDAGRAVASYEGLSAEPPAVDAVGHRIVHGGPDFTKPALVDAGIERRLRHLAELPPLHQVKSLRTRTARAAAAAALWKGCRCCCGPATTPPRPTRDWGWRGYSRSCGASWNGPEPPAAAGVSQPARGDRRPAIPASRARHLRVPGKYIFRVPGG